MVVISTNLTPLHVVDSAIGAMFLAPQEVPNPAPKVIPSLREWQGNTGIFTMSSASRIAVDPSYIAQLKDTAKAFQGDLFAVTGYTLPTVTTLSPGVGDFFLTLNNLDPGMGNEGNLFQLVDTVVISAHKSKEAFYATRPPCKI